MESADLITVIIVVAFYGLGFGIPIGVWWHQNKGTREFHKYMREEMKKSIEQMARERAGDPPSEPEYKVGDILHIKSGRHGTVTNIFWSTQYKQWAYETEELLIILEDEVVSYAYFGSKDSPIITIGHKFNSNGSKENK